MTSIAELKVKSGILTAKNEKIEQTKKSTLISVWSTIAPIGRARRCLLEDYSTEGRLGCQLQDTVLAVLADQVRQKRAHLKTLLE